MPSGTVPVTNPILDSSSDSDWGIVAVAPPRRPPRPAAPPARPARPCPHPRLSGSSDSSSSDDDPLQRGIATCPAISAARRPVSRTQSDTSLLPRRSPRAFRPPLAPRAPVGGRSCTTRSASGERRPPLKRLGDVLSSGSDSGLSADEDMRKGKARAALSDVGAAQPQSQSQSQTPSQTQTTSQGKKRARSDPSEKQRQAEAKKAEREAAQALRERIKAEKAAQAKRDKAWQEANKLRTDKVQTMAELRVEVDYLLTAPDGPIPRAYPLIKQSIEEDGAEIVVIPQQEVSRRRHRSLVMATDEQLQECLAGLSTVRVVRRSRATLDPVRRTFVPLPNGQVNLEEEKTIFVIVTHLHLLDMVEKKTLLTTLRSFRLCMGYETHQVVLLTFGLDTFFRLRDQAANREYTRQIRNQVEQAAGAGGTTGTNRRGGRSKQTHSIHVTREQLDTELIRLRIAERVYLTKLEKEHDLVPWFSSMVRDIAIRPYKLLARSHLPIPVVGGKFPSGNNARETFELMLRQIPRITPQFAAEIVSHFGTLRAFLDRCAQVLAESQGRINDHGLPAASDELVQEIAQIEVERTRSGQLASQRNRNKSALARRIVFVFLSLDALALVSS